MSSKIYFYRKANIKECPRLTFFLLFSLHILIIAISFGNVFLDRVTLIFCFKIISGKFLLNEFWLQVMSKILWCGGLTHITNGLNSYFPLIYSLPCRSTISPLLQLNFFSALYNAWCRIWETQMTTCHFTSVNCPGFLLCERRQQRTPDRTFICQVQRGGCGLDVTMQLTVGNYIYTHATCGAHGAVFEISAPRVNMLC